MVATIDPIVPNLSPIWLNRFKFFTAGPLFKYWIENNETSRDKTETFLPASSNFLMMEGSVSVRMLSAFHTFLGSSGLSVLFHETAAFRRLI